MNLSTRLLTFSLAACLCPVVQAGVLTVDDDGPAQFTEISDAVAAAVDGDIILVQSGSYGSFTVDGIGLSIEADTGAAVVLDGNQALIRIRNVPLGKTVSIRGIDVAGTSFFPQPLPELTYALYGHDNAGHIWIEDCVITAGLNPTNEHSNTGAAQFQNSVSVVLVNSQLQGGKAGNPSFEFSHGLVVMNSVVSVYGCDIAGGDSVDQTDLTYPGPALPGAGIMALGGSKLIVSGSTVSGGSGGNGLDGVDGLFHCKNGGQGWHGIITGFNSQTETVNSVITGGDGGEPGFQPATSSQVCSPGQDGKSHSAGLGSNLNEHTGTSSYLHLSSPAREGQQVQFSYSSEPGNVGFLAFGLAARNGLYLTGWIGAIFVDGPYSPISLGVLPASGQGGFSMTVPELGPGLLGLPVFAQAVFVDASEGTVTLSSPSRTILLDASL